MATFTRERLGNQGVPTDGVFAFGTTPHLLNFQQKTDASHYRYWDEALKDESDFPSLPLLETMSPCLLDLRPVMLLPEKHGVILAPTSSCGSHKAARGDRHRRLPPPWAQKSTQPLGHKST